MRIPTASFAIRALSRFSHSRLRNLHTLPLPLSRTLQQQPRLFSTSFQAFNSSTNIPPKQAQKSSLVEQPDNPQPPSPKRPDQPSYDITFTCTPCSTRSTHRITKQGYHHGSILITCPSCRNRHVISDHLNIFGDKHVTVEDLMREQGQLIKKGTLSEDGDLEFWEDGTSTTRKNDDTVSEMGGQRRLE